ncbi:FAD-binding oxidoreductase [Nocardioides sp. SYSU DS0663]|uniref:FAD-binding oxidoreductase n=1 Tax=Nocardioides sp. SYSU DS0663 TaxID=3416445 RepID=UPI003F4BC788
MTSATAREQHTQAVARLRSSYAAIPAGAPVRLAKGTSNLFRPRSAGAGAGLDVSGLTGVLAVDPEARTADVQGMCTYEDLVAVTLAHGLAPLVVPQLRTITLGGAVTGLGIESTSFRNGLPHESVLEMDVLTGAGELVTARPGPTGEHGQHADLFDAFPNSYGSLGYATRLRIELAPVPSYVRLRHVRVAPHLLVDTIESIVRTRQHDGARVDGLDGVAFAPDEVYLTLATWQEEPGPTSDYTGRDIYYRSVRQRPSDLLTTEDYFWRWDTDWFWCSAAFGAQHPVVRRLWPRRWRRSDVYHRLVGLDRRYGVVDRLDRRAGRPERERVIQDVEVPVERLPEFLAWFDRAVGMRPVWLCPLVARRRWPAYPLEPGATYVNVGFWGTVHVGPEAGEAPVNRAVEEKVHELGGHKSLYSEAFYDRETFDRLYAGEHLAEVKRTYDPDDRLTSLYDKVVRRR